MPFNQRRGNFQNSNHGFRGGGTGGGGRRVEFNRDRRINNNNRNFGPNNGFQNRPNSFPNHQRSNNHINSVPRPNNNNNQQISKPSNLPVVAKPNNSSKNSTPIKPASNVQNSSPSSNNSVLPKQLSSPIVLSASEPIDKPSQAQQNSSSAKNSNTQQYRPDGNSNHNLHNKSDNNRQHRPNNSPTKRLAPKNEDLEIKKDEKRPTTYMAKCRLFVGNLASGTTEEDFKKIFENYGEISEIYVHADKGFAFVQLSNRESAELAKFELDGKSVRGRTLRIRFATAGSTISVKNLSNTVSNELLYEAFSIFGQVDRAVVVVDEKGRSLGKGIVEFARKAIAVKAIQQIKENCFLITASPRAISAEFFDKEDVDNGLPEKSILKTQQYQREREAPPRFAQPGSFEEQYARRWKALDDLECEQRKELERNLQASREKLESEMEFCLQEHQAMLMKQDLLRRQEELERLEEERKRDMERRQQLELARMDLHNKELAERKHRQDMLRAQIEGTQFNSGGDYGVRGQSGRGMGRNSPPPHQSIDIGGHELISQGGLAPAPSRFDQRSDFAKLIAAGVGAAGAMSSLPPPPGLSQRHDDLYQHDRRGPPPSAQHDDLYHQQQQRGRPQRGGYQDFNEPPMMAKRRRF